ncbi:hypothetical protein [Micromonospora ureilytica]|uniref:hypothetical protein n=1 Tax=Micromonospora ureilytica TaxID=709868 RepID=UPI004039827E
MRTLDLHDGLSVEFRKHANDGYVAIERLAHGQKCTAILIVTLADGNDPLIIDQPEDAFHAPWIEEYLVAKLRDLRGSRQYRPAGPGRQTESTGRLADRQDHEQAMPLGPVRGSDDFHGQFDTTMPSTWPRG